MTSSRRRESVVTANNVRSAGDFGAGKTVKWLMRTA
jgi:hypothetical protein